MAAWCHHFRIRALRQRHQVAATFLGESQRSFTDTSKPSKLPGHSAQVLKTHEVPKLPWAMGKAAVSATTAATWLCCSVWNLDRYGFDICKVDPRSFSLKNNAVVWCFGGPFQQNIERATEPSKKSAQSLVFIGPKNQPFPKPFLVYAEHIVSRALPTRLCFPVLRSDMFATNLLYT